MTEVLAFDGVSRRFGERWVIRAGTLAVHAGEVVALLGRNGCGKTTMLRIACGIVRSESGHVRVHGRRIYRPRLHRLAAEGLFLLPERDLLTPTSTVGHHLERLAARWAGDPAEAIEMLGIGGLLDRFPVQLSGGERRRAELALAVARRPAVLLADEPFQGIAP
ncbi:MAG TPA: ATP-binding cassette domain-containing protein, partial [Albitalea sp.]